MMPYLLITQETIFVVSSNFIRQCPKTNAVLKAFADIYTFTFNGSVDGARRYTLKFK